jgi:hypothetical protein
VDEEERDGIGTFRGLVEVMNVDVAEAFDFDGLSVIRRESVHGVLASSEDWYR